MQKLSRSLFALGVLAGLAACGDDVSVVGPPPVVPAVTGISVSPPAVQVTLPGGTAQLSAVVTTNDPSVATTVTWASANIAVATVSATGLVTAVTAGSTTVTATSTANANFRAGAQVTVLPRDLGVRSVRISPDNAIVPTAATLQLVANVDANAGVARTVTWSSSNAAVASVSTTGVVTGVTAGSATITAASTVDPSVTGAAAITVRNPVPATISIASITFAGPLGPNQPVNVNATFGQIEVTLNVDPGDQLISRVDVLIDGAVACGQAFSVSRSEELSLAHVFENVQAAPVSCSINTALFNAITGVAAYLNGARQISARAILAGGSSIATPSQTLVFANANAFVATQTFTGTIAVATNATGFTYRRGGLSISVLPVIYNAGQSVAVGGTATFGSAGCDASPTASARTVALVAPAAGSSAWTATFSSTATAGTTNVTNYEFNGCALFNPAGEVVTVTAADNNGNTLFAATAPANAAALGLRLDNRAPGAPTFMANPNIRQNSWLNASVGLTGLNTSLTDNDWLVNGAADAGVGGYTRMLRTGAGPTAAAAIATAGSNTPTLPAPSLNNTDYCAVISATDLLGNESALPTGTTVCTAPPVASSTAVLAQHLQFGVDIAAPTIAFSGGLASGARIPTATVAAEFQVTVTDTGTVGNSGMLSGSAVRGTVQIRNATSAAICFVGTVDVNGVCQPASVNVAPPFPLVPTTTVAASITTGYFTYVAFSQDAAGNQSGTVTRVVAHDDGGIAGNVPALTTALFNVPLSGSTATFNANSSDNFDLWTAIYTMTYAGGLGGPIIFPTVTLNTFNVAPLVNSNVPAGITVNGFMRQVENVTANNPVTVGGQFKPTTLTGVARDQANNPSVAAVTPIPAASVTTGVSYLAAAAPQLIRSWAITGPVVATNVSTGATTPAANPLSVTITMDAFGPTATFSPPFSTVNLFVVFGGNLVQIGTASFVGTTDDGSAFGRRHRYTFSWTPGTAFGTALQTIFAIGVNGNGDALVSPGNMVITTTNP